MTKTLPVFLLACISAVATGNRSFAGDWYVDAVNGSNSNNGTSPTDAWRTLTWAVAHTPVAQGDTIHVAAGVYDTALGEVFPILVRSEQRIVGVDRDSVIVDGIGTFTTPMFKLEATGPTDIYSPHSGMERLSLRNGAAGIYVVAIQGVMSAQLVDLAIDNIETNGIGVSSASTLRSAPSIERISVRRCDVGLSCSGTTVQGVKLSIRDSVFAGNDTLGIVVDDCAELVLERCRCEHNGVGGLRTFTPYTGHHLSVVALDSLFSRNGGFGISHTYAPVSAQPGSVSSDIERCTIVDNMDIGVQVSGFNPALGVTIRGSILARNPIDVSVSAANAALIVASNSLIGDGFGSGANGCFSADPAFRDAAHGDYRLTFDSPCVDAGAANAGVLYDLAGRPRTLDGDLDLVKRTDLGAYELAPLDGPASVSIGSVLTLEVWGAAGATSRVLWSRQPMSNVPQPTPFGPSYLQLPHLLRIVSTLGSEPVLVSRLVPNSPLIVGLTYSFQARTQSGDAPAGEAYTNPLAITIVP
jgi:hypothetical protein